MQVLRVVEDRRACSADLARVIEADPALSARVMRLANSPYYGLTRRVGSASAAVVLLGFSAVRALAVSAAYGVIVDESGDGLPGFWAHSVSAAVGASCVARIAGAPRNEAFSAGLLHEIGLGSRCLVDEHDAKGAKALEAWRFPETLVQAVAEHHRPGVPATTCSPAWSAPARRSRWRPSRSGRPTGRSSSVEDAVEDCGGGARPGAPAA